MQLMSPLLQHGCWLLLHILEAKCVIHGAAGRHRLGCVLLVYAVSLLLLPPLPPPLLLLLLLSHTLEARQHARELLVRTDMRHLSELQSA